MAVWNERFEYLSIFNGIKWLDTLGFNGLLRKRGTTEQRPIVTNEDVGFQYFDETLNLPIWYNGTNWINGIGTIV